MIIYKVTNLVNGKCYVGQTRMSLQNRWKHHRYAHGCSALHSAIEKYGVENFTIEQIDSADTQDELNQKEQFWIAKLNTLSPNGYNLTTGGESPVWCEDSRLRMSESKKGNYPSEETRKILREVKLGERNSFYGKHHTDESKQKISASKKGQLPWTAGQAWSDENIQKIRLGQKTRKPIRCIETGKCYDSIRHACKQLNLSNGNLGRALRGLAHTCGGFHWEYIKDEIE